jgi:hypothetical protein
MTDMCHHAQLFIGLRYSLLNFLPRLEAFLSISTPRGAVITGMNHRTQCILSFEMTMDCQMSISSEKLESVYPDFIFHSFKPPELKEHFLSKKV